MRSRFVIFPESPFLSSPKGLMLRNCLPPSLLLLTLLFGVDTVVAYDKEHLERFKKEKQCEECGLTSGKFSKMELQGANLRGSNLFKANFYKSDLNNANLSETNLSSSNLKMANLQGANLRGANLKRANLQEAILFEADLTGANLEDVKLLGTVLNGATWTNGEPCLEGSLGKCVQ